MEQHKWKFIRAGGVDQVVIRSGADIVNLEHLDQKLWVALACPTRGIEVDARTLDLIDTDKDGRIRPPELIAASHWVREHFKNPEDLLEGGDTVALAAINVATASGEALLEEAQRTLALVGKKDADSICLADVLERSGSFAALPFNGDGIVPPQSVDDERLRALIDTIIETHGAVIDRSGHPGVDQAKVDAFFADAAALDGWHRKGAASEGALPLGERTLAAAAAVAAVRDKLEDYYTRCRLAAYDPAASTPLNPSQDEYRAMAPKELAMSSTAIAELPLALVAPDRPLPLKEGLNPAWAGAIETLRVEALQPLLQRELDVLSENDWRTAKARLARCDEWLTEKPQTPLEKLGIERLREILAGDAHDALTALIEEDKGAEPQSARIADLERLVRFKRDLVHLLNNFVSFAEFYARQDAIFEAGRLYLDARSCDLTVQVADAAKHAALAGLAKVYLAYCECTRGGEKMTIVSAFTAGDVDYLLVGRNGIFYDRKGRDWDATITRVIENPISIRQAFFSPYKKFVRMIEEQVAKRAAEGEARSQGRLTNVATAATTADKKPAAPTPPGVPSAGPRRRIDVGTVAALGVALGSISAVLVGVFANFIELGWWIPVAIVGIILAISGPSMLIAWLKLRQRSLGPILDASGWAINGRMRINVPLGASLSKTAKVPAGAERRWRDPYAETRSGLYFLLALVLLAAAAFTLWRLGYFDAALTRAIVETPVSQQPAAAP